MCNCKINGKSFNAEFDVTPSADFIQCLFPAVIAALPAFLESFMKCIAGAGTPDSHNPGDRKRC